MLPKTYNLVAVPNFGAPANFKVEFTPYRIDPATGDLVYGTTDNSINETANTDTAAPSSTKNNATDKMYGLNGVLEISGTNLTGFIDVFVVNQESTVTSDNSLSKPIASISFTGQTATKRLAFEA